MTTALCITLSDSLERLSRAVRRSETYDRTCKYDLALGELRHAKMCIRLAEIDLDMLIAATVSKRLESER